jgi:WD40 repeat protein
MDASTRSECLQGTRSDLILDWVGWTSNLWIDQRIVWLHGVAGSGKSTFSTTFANIYRLHGRLGAFVFFERDVEERSHVSNVIRTLAYQLGSFDDRIGTAIAAAIKTTPSISDSPLRLQFIKLLVEPISTLPATEPPIILVLDALDECGNTGERKTLLHLLAAESIHLPLFVRIVITSRAEFDIRSAFADQPHVRIQELELSSDANIKDILSFLRSRMAAIQSANTFLNLAHDWPGKEAVSALCQHAAGLFVWAATACCFIELGHDPRKRLNILLRGDINTDANVALAALYETALVSAGRWDDVDFCLDFKIIMGAILVARNPLSDNALDALLFLERPSRHTTARLGCVLRWSNTEPIRILHPSFGDFLSNRLRCGSHVWYIDKPLHNRSFSVQCINYLDQALRRNLVDMTLSFDYMDVSLCEELSYACTFWIEHVCTVTEDTASLAIRLDTFLHTHLLHWLECMSILKRSRMAIKLLYRLREWVKASVILVGGKETTYWESQHYCPERTNIFELVGDACRFVQFFVESIEDHPLLIYVTALPFTPTGSHLYKTFHDKASHPYITGDVGTSWSPVLLTIPDGQVPCCPVTVLKFLPQCILWCGADLDGNISIRALDATTGREVVPSVKWHKDDVTCMGISYDGRRVALGTNDGTICMWDRRDGLEVALQFLGHKNAVNCLTFSCDGSHIVSGSADKTICVWNIAIGAETLPPLRGHEGPVTSIAFSSDGTRILSGSEDTTIRVWDTLSGSIILTPLQGHEGCVAFSPDGTKIASELTDGTIHLWDVKEDIIGEKTLAPEGHPQVLCLVFSFDGTRIASGSFDGTIYMWDAVSGAVVCMMSEPSVSIRSLAYHPDGKHIISSGEVDDSISIWDTSSSTSEEISPEMGLGVSESVVFSPDGMLVVSASHRYVHTWDAESGRKIRSHFQEWHRGSIMCVAFSSDGLLIVSSSPNNTLSILNTSSGNEVIIPLRAALICSQSIRGDIYSRSWPNIVFSPDGNLIAANLNDSTMQVWDATSGKGVSLPLHGHESGSCMAFSPSRKRIVANSSEEKVRVWNIESDVEALTMTFPKDSQYPKVSDHPPCAFSADGTRISAMSSRGMCSVWDAMSGDHISNIDTHQFYRDFGSHPIVLD